MKYPIGIQSFERIRQDGYVYIDKTDMVYSLTHEGSVYFLSRPRRFGKSLLVSTIEAYYLGRKELFEGLKISSLETEWKSYPVFHVDFSNGNFAAHGTLEELLNGYLTRWEEEYGIRKRFEDFGLRFADVLDEVYRKVGIRCVVLIDEYDKPLLDVMDTENEEHNRNILKGFYSTFKAADSSLQFVLLTGVTKFSQVSVFSGFNQPDDISMSAQYETLCGITEQEMLETFSEPIGNMALAYGCSIDEMVGRLRRQYDGYHFSRKMTGVYNPFSLLKSLKQLEIADFWFQTGSPAYLVRLLADSDEQLDELTGKYYSASQFVDYKADREMPLPMIYQSGYLTIKDYDRETESFLLDFPNDEVERGFVEIVAGNYFRTGALGPSSILSFVKSLNGGDLGSFMSGLTAFLASIPYNMRRKDNEREKERFFHYTFYLIFRLMSTYTVYTEKCQSRGRVDCVIETESDIYIFEFKLDGSAEDALRQIESQGYAREYASDSRHLHKVGVNFSSVTGTVDGWRVID